MTSSLGKCANPAQSPRKRVQALRRGHRSPVPAGSIGPAHSIATRDELQTLAYELTVAEARERERIARDLHDEIGQLLTIAKLKLGELRQSAVATQEPLLLELGELIADATRATRAVTFDLCCPILRLGLIEALTSVAQRVTRSGAGVQMHLQGQLPALGLAEPVLAVVFRVVRELALNVQKHAHATRALIDVGCEGSQLVISVSDDGQGFDAHTAGRGFSREGGFGLLSAQAQMQAVGGRLEIDSAPSRGTCATIVLGLPA